MGAYARMHTGSSYPYGTIVLMLVTAGIYAWVLADRDVAYDLLSADYAMLYREPWRVFTSLFLHGYAPHFLFNLVTLWLFGHNVERHFHSRTLLVTFFGAMLTGHVAQMLADGIYVVGISGGICGLYGFLLCMDKRSTLRATLAQRPSYWLYPLALLLLAVIDRVGAASVATLSHLLGMFFGYVVGLACAAGPRQSGWRSVTFTLLVLACIPLVYRPWEQTWQALYDTYDASAILPQFPCEQVRRPSGNVAENSFVDVTVRDLSERKKRFYYYDQDGQKVLNGETHRQLYRMRPYLESVWRIENEVGQCHTQFEVVRAGIIELD